MDRCKDCIHFGICKNGFPWADGKGGGWCEDFKSKANCVEVVRCKDCKHFRKHKDGDYCYAKIRPTKEDDFCSYGERREE